MRDPSRIPVVLDALRIAWEKHPDLRLAQLVSVASKKSDPFYVEDLPVLAGLIELGKDE